MSADCADDRAAWRAVYWPCLHARGNSLLSGPAPIDSGFCRPLGGQAGDRQGPSAASSRGLTWTEIEIRRDEAGRPAVAVRGAIKDLIERQGVTEIMITFSHCRMHATAYAIAMGKE